MKACRPTSSITIPVCLLLLAAPQATAATSSNLPPGNAWIARYFADETARLESACLAGIHSLEDWTRHRPEYRRQLQEMLGLDPWPDRTPLAAVVTGKAETSQFIVEKLHFQSLPGLYVTANLYLPKGLSGPAPAILYVCGHGPVVREGVSYGNKVAYQHHGAWLAENGYVCLVIDTLQLGEIQGIHHGTHRFGMWWWNSRGYTPAGVEAWNGIRALDYLETRSEVDRARLGVTGRSGGGAYSWTVAALDDRVRVAAPVAGITDLRNHVVDGVVEGHCDCMFFVNTYGWDYPQLAALLVPRPLLLANTDRDSIFPLDGIVRTHAHLRRLYQLHGASTNLGLLITEGPHKDTQDLQLPVLRWFNRFLKQEEPKIASAALPRFEPGDLRVLAAVPADSRNTNIHASFVPAAPPPPAPASTADWTALQDRWMTQLSRRTFGNTPVTPGPPPSRESARPERHGLRFRTIDFETHPGLALRLCILEPRRGRAPARLHLDVLDESAWQTRLNAARYAFPDAPDEQPSLTPTAVPRAPGKQDPPGDATAFAALEAYLRSNACSLAWFAPRGIGPTAWQGDTRYHTHLRRRFMLLGQTLDSMRVWDIRQALRLVRHLDGNRDRPVTLRAEGHMAANALYASLFELPVHSLELSNLPPSHADGPDYLNVLKILDLPQAVALAASRSDVLLTHVDPDDWTFARSTVASLHWPRSRLQFR